MLVVPLKGINLDTSDGWKDNYHFADIANIAGLVPVNKGAVLFPDVLKLHALLIVVLAIVVEHKPVVFIVHGPEFA